MQPTFRWAEMAKDTDRSRYQKMFQRALSACCNMQGDDAVRMWTTHAGRVGMQTDADERQIDRRKSRLIGGWSRDSQQRSQDGYSRTLATLAGVNAERGF